MCNQSLIPTCAKNNTLKHSNPVILKSDDEFSTDDHRFMTLALTLAKKGADLGEVPVGAVVVLEGQIIAQSFNCPITTHDSTAHAEMVAIRQACQQMGNYRLTGATLYVTLEPCTMCLGAIVHARIARVVFGTTEPKAGVIISQENFSQKTYFNHYLQLEYGLMATQSKALLQGFFKKRRTQKKHIDTTHSSQDLTSLTQALADNTFIDDLRQKLYFNNEQYDELIHLLTHIAKLTKHTNTLSKHLTLYLYDIPRMVFVWKERLKLDNPPYHHTLIDQLEDAWIELDALILEEIILGELPDTG